MADVMTGQARCSRATLQMLALTQPHQLISAHIVIKGSVRLNISWLGIRTKLSPSAWRATN